MSRGIATTLVLAGLERTLPGRGYSNDDRAASGGLPGAGTGITAVAGADLSATGHAITHSATQSTP